MIQTDYLDAMGASLLADRIRAYWMQRQQTVKVWVEPVFVEGRKAGATDGNKQAVIYQVRSDLVNGSPRDGDRYVRTESKNTRRAA